MPNPYFRKRRGPVTHPSDHPDIKMRRRLARLIKQHKGAMSRLAAQQCAFASPSSRQNRFFATALIENWCCHMLYNKELYSRSDLMPQVPLPSHQWDVLSAQLPVWNSISTSLASPSVYKNQRIWPRLSSNQSTDREGIPVRCFDGSTLNWAKKILLAQGSRLHLLTRQRVNYLLIRNTPDSSEYNYWNEQMGQASQGLAKIKQQFTLFVSDNLSERRAVWESAWQRIKSWSSLQQPARIITGLNNFQALLSSAPASFYSNLDKRSRIFVIIDGMKDKIDDLAELRLKAASIFNIQAERISWLWCQAETAAVIWSCPTGRFHLPIYYRLIDGEYFCNPLAKNYPTLYSKLPGKIFDKWPCTCGA
ncbi:MAG: hypothetical protein ACI38Q_05720 [Candidatus Bruticola sp.]